MIILQNQNLMSDCKISLSKGKIIIDLVSVLGLKINSLRKLLKIKIKQIH